MGVIGVGELDGGVSVFIFADIDLFDSFSFEDWDFEDEVFFVWICEGDGQGDGFVIHRGFGFDVTDAVSILSGDSSGDDKGDGF